MDHNIINGINEVYASIQEAYTVQGHARIGSTAAKATDKSVSGAVDKALANKGTAVSASSEKGKTGVTGGGSFKMSGSIGGGSNKPKPTTDPGSSRPKPTNNTSRPTGTTPKVPNDSGRPTRPVRVQNQAADVRTTSTGGGGRGGLRSDTTSDLDVYNLVLEYLLDEGFASSEQSADKIILNMSESWFEEIMEARRSEKEGKGSPESPMSYPGRKIQKERGERGGRHQHSGSVEYGGAAAERGRKKSDPHSQYRRLEKLKNYPEKSGKYSEMQRKKRGGDIGSRFD